MQIIVMLWSGKCIGQFRRNVSLSGFPLGLENLEKWEGILQSGKSRGILNRLEKSGKITQNIGKLREFEINII